MLIYCFNISKCFLSSSGENVGFCSNGLSGWSTGEVDGTVGVFPFAWQVGQLSWDELSTSSLSNESSTSLTDGNLTPISTLTVGVG